MQIRRAQVKDIPAIMKLLSQVLEIHASIRPDIFIPGTTKYTVEELTTIINDDQKAVFVAVDEDAWLCVHSAARAAFFNQYGSV